MMDNLFIKWTIVCFTSIIMALIDLLLSVILGLLINIAYLLCNTFRAMVVENRDVWFEDDGGLTKELCEDQQDNDDEQPEVNEPCCACDEAKYEVFIVPIYSHLPTHYYARVLRPVHTRGFSASRKMKDENQKMKKIRFHLRLFTLQIFSSW